MKRTFILLSLLYSMESLAQIHAVLQGDIRDSISGEALGAAVVQVSGTPYSARTSSDGSFMIAMDLNEPFNAEVHVYFTGYQEKIFFQMIRRSGSIDLN